MDKKPCKIIWDVPWEELMAVELAKAGSPRPSHLILHLRNFKRSENFARVIKCTVEEESSEGEPQAVRISSVVRKMWKAFQSDMKSLILKVIAVYELEFTLRCHIGNPNMILHVQVPSSQRHVYFAWSESHGKDPYMQNKSIIQSRELSSFCSTSDERRFVKHSINFLKIWSSEQNSKGRCTLCRMQVYNCLLAVSIFILKF